MGLTALMKLSFLGWRAWCIAYGEDKAYARAISSYTLRQFHAGTWSCIKRSCLRFFSHSFGENVQCGLSSKACAHLFVTPGLSQAGGGCCPSWKPQHSKFSPVYVQLAGNLSLHSLALASPVRGMDGLWPRGVGPCLQDGDREWGAAVISCG